jgi:hypothetical protein
MPDSSRSEAFFPFRVACWRITLLGCDAKFGRYPGGIADIDQAAPIKLDL